MHKLAPPVNANAERAHCLWRHLQQPQPHPGCKKGVAVPVNISFVAVQSVKPKAFSLSRLQWEQHLLKALSLV